jgi:hypothetical protein
MLRGQAVGDLEGERFVLARHKEHILLERRGPACKLRIIEEVFRVQATKRILEALR